MNTGSDSKHGASEIERKFLVRELPFTGDAKRLEIIQGYLAVDSDGTEVRLRRIGPRHVITVKTGAGLHRGEIEIEVSAEQFEALWPATERRRLEKARVEVPYQGSVIELDTYHGKLEGLHVAEVEFESEEESAVFHPPDWFGREVTDESAYKNRSLAARGLPENP